MRKTAAAAVFLAAVLALSGCGLFHTHIDTVDPNADYTYVTSPTLPRASEPATVLTDAVLPTAAVQPTAPDPGAPVYETSQPAASVPEPGTAAPAASAAPETTAAPAPATAPAPAADPQGEIDLSVSLPEPNGKMEVSKDPSNPLIAAVQRERGIDPAYTVAVYAVPASGQNYVFEFTSPTVRSADTLRRVYLLSDDGRIQSVAAASSSEVENLSVTENWFCFTVLIKGMVLPAVKDRF